MKKILLVAIILLQAALSLTAADDDAQIFSRLDSVIRQVQRDWNINSLVVQVGDANSVLFSRGYGWRDDEAAERVPVDSNTLFQIASVSKSFTTYLVASLVDEGKLSWDDRVADILPDFRMYDPWVTENLLVKDLSCHRTGLGGNAGASIARLGFSKEEMMHMMRLMEPAYPFRSGYQYCNHTFCVSALIVEKITGKSWEENVRERIYKPLGMERATFRGSEYAEAFANGTASQPYGWSSEEGRFKITRLTPEDVRPGTWAASEAAGGIICTPAEMLRWAQFHLNRGAFNGRQLISKKQMDYLHKGVNIVSQGPSQTTLYGHGWLMEQSPKGRMVWHTGTNSGQISICVFLPDISRVITINANTQVPNPPRFAIVRSAIDLLKGLPLHDYNGEYLAQWHSKHAERPAEKKSLLDFKPDDSRLTGTYANGEWGDVTVGRDETGLFIDLNRPGYRFPLEHVEGSVFSFNSSSTHFKIEFSMKTWPGKAQSFKYLNTGATVLGTWTRKDR